MVVVRLSRGGAKKRPFYHIVATDSRRRRDAGNAIERLGYFNPIARGQELRVHLNLERIRYWQSVGAGLSQRVAALLVEWERPAKQSA